MGDMMNLNSIFTFFIQVELDTKDQSADSVD